MFWSRAASVFGAVSVTVALAAPGGVDLVPELTSTPFGAVGGQSVTHTIVLAGTGSGTVTGVRLTFTTTVDLEKAVATSTQGHCSIAGARTVVCDLGTVSPPATPPKVTITGTVAPGSGPGTLIQNLVSVASADADASNNQASNAYLIPGTGATPVAAPAPAATPQRPSYLVPVAAGVLVAGALASVALVRRRRR
jgi:hypothetical protein